VSEPLLLGGVVYTPNVVTAWDGMRWPWPRRVSIRSRSLAESMHYDASRRTVRPWQSHRTRRSAGDSNHRPLLVQLVDGGKIIGDEPLEVMRERHLRVRAELPLEALKMSRGEPVMETLFGGTGGDVRNPCRTEPGGELRAAGSVADVIAGPTREL